MKPWLFVAAALAGAIGGVGVGQEAPADQPPLPTDPQGTILADDQPQVSAYERSVVLIMAIRQDFDYTAPWKKQPMTGGVGSGFVIDGQRILTNAHNVSNARYIEISKQYTAKRYPAQVEFVGHDCDLAVLKVADPTFFDDMTPLPLGGIPQVNSTVYTCGFPLGGRQISITKGVVSRIETGIYSHSQADAHMIIQTDAAINPGNSGGPALQAGKVVGVAFQGIQTAENMGFLIPTTVIQHFLTDILDGTYDGFGSLGAETFQGLHNRAYRAFLNVPAEVEGVVVTEITRNSTVDGILQKGDVLAEIDGYAIDLDGQIHIDGLRLDFSEAIDRKQIGQTFQLVFYRQGQRHQVTIPTAVNAPLLNWARQYDNEPSYYIYAGLAFVPLTRNFLENWGRNWINDIPSMLRYLFFHANDLIDDTELKELVVLSDILPDEVNAYLVGFKHQVVESVNGVKIKSLKDLRSTLDKDAEPVVQVRFYGNDTPMVIDRAVAQRRLQPILDRYNVPSQTNITE